MKAGGKIHGEPKLRDPGSGYYSAAVIDSDGNSIEAVYRPSISSARSEATGPDIPLLESGSVVSKASSRASSAKPESIAPPRSEARSSVSKATTAVDRAAPSEYSVPPSEKPAPSVTTREVHQPVSSPTYVVNHTTHTTQTQKSDDGNPTAKTIVGSLIGAAAGAALAYAWTSSGDSESPSSESTAPPQHSPHEWAALPSPGSQAPSQAQEPGFFRAIEAAPAKSTYSQSEFRPTLTRSVTSKNPRASTIYEGTEYAPPKSQVGSVYTDENGRRASDGSVYSGIKDLPLRAIEYAPSVRSESQHGNSKAPSLISSFVDQSRTMNDDNRSVYSSSTAKPSKANYQDDRSCYYAPSNHSSASKSKAGGSTASSNRTARNIPLPEGSVASFTSYRSGAKSGVSARDVPLPKGSVASSYRSGAKSHVSARDVPLPEGSVASSYRSGAKSYVSARDVPLPQGSVASFSTSRSGAKSHVSARDVPLPESVVGVDVNTHVTPDDSISQIDVGDDDRKSSYSAHRSKTGGSRASKPASKFNEPVRPSDSVSQISSHSKSSQRTVKASGHGPPTMVAGGSGGSKVGGGSKVSSSRRASQVA